MSKNLTLSLNEELLRAARKVAFDRNTSVNQMVRDFLERVVWETDQRQAALTRLDEIFRTQRIELLDDLGSARTFMTAERLPISCTQVRRHVEGAKRTGYRFVSERGTANPTSEQQ